MMWDLPNLLVCWVVVFTAYLLGKIQRDHAICLAAISLVPYCLNNVLFDPAYMPDQYTYWRMLTAIRDFSYNPNFYNSRVTEASYIYAFLPLPFIETVSSLGFFNKFLLIVLFIWASTVLKLRGWILWFLMLYPSLLLYSSLGLRDMLICLFMVFALWSLLRGWYLLTVICIAVLVQIKMQNALLVTLFSFWYVLDRGVNFQFTRNKFWGLMIGFLTLGYFIFPYLVTKIEYYRLRMYLEDGGVMADYQPIHSFFDLLAKSTFGIMRTLFSPFLWDAQGALQLLQSAENIFIAILLFVFTVNSYKCIPKQTIMWFFFLLSSMMMYGLIVNNTGTLVRYKLPFIVVYLIFLSYERIRYSQAKGVNEWATALK